MQEVKSDSAASRSPSGMRNIRFIPNFTKHAAGSVLSCFYDTKVLCTVTFLKGYRAF